MLSAIKKQFKTQCRDWLGIMTVLMLGAAVFGGILFAVIAALDHETDSYFAMGTVIAGIMAVMFTGIMMMASLSQLFNLEVSMGCTRKHFFISYYTLGFFVGLCGVVMLWLINMAENTMNRVMYPGMSEEISFLPYLLKWSIPVMTVILVLAGFCGALMMRFGKVAGWILWFLWMFGWLGLPRIQEAVEKAPDSLFGRIGSIAADMLRMVPLHTWVCIAVLVSILAFAETWVLLRRQQVTS